MVNRQSKRAQASAQASTRVERIYNPTEMIKRPVFLVGSERSGTTLLGLMLDHHPNIMFWDGFEYATKLVSDRGQYPAMADYYRWLQSNSQFLMDAPTIDRQLAYPMLVNSFLRQFQHFSPSPKALIGATVHHHFDRVLHIWPDAVFIHMVRDGRDVARSCIKMGWAGDGWHGAARWLQAETLWDKLKLQLPESRRLEVRFEQLVENAPETLERVCQFMGDRYHPDMMKYPETTGYSLPDMSLVNQWHRNVSKREIQLIEARIAPLLVERGYPLSGLPAVRVTPQTQLLLKIQNKLGILHRRTRKYGLPLASADFIARRLGLRKLSDRINKKLSVIDTKSMTQSW
ncbi:MAG: sulfotransferase [Cyanobacteria bacterium J06588_5]